MRGAPSSLTATGLALALGVALGGSACGRYGPPVRGPRTADVEEAVPERPHAESADGSEQTATKAEPVSDAAPSDVESAAGPKTGSNAPFQESP